MGKVYHVIGSFYGGERLDRLLGHLRYLPKNRDYSILVNEQRGDQRKPSGFAHVYNRLIDAAFADQACELVWIMGDDVMPQEDCLHVCEERLRDDPTIGAIFPTEAWISKVGALRAETIIPFVDGVGRLTTIQEALQEGEPEVEQLFAGFACACLTRDAWEAVGPMDEGLGKGYAEDLDWGLRCWKAGYRIVNHRRTWFMHEQGATYRQMIKDGHFGQFEGEEAAHRVKKKYDFLWNGEPWAESLARLHAWRDEALRTK